MFGWLRKPKSLSQAWHDMPEVKNRDKRLKAYLSDETCPQWARPTVANMVHVTGLLAAAEKRLDEQMHAEEKQHPSCMWDWISPDRIRRPYRV